MNRETLFGQLNPLLYQGLEGATAFCKLRGNPYVELAHWMHQLLQTTNGDIARLLAQAGQDIDAVRADVVQALDRLPRGATAIADFSAHIDEAVERAWVFGSLQGGGGRLRGAYLLIGLLQTPNLRSVLLGMSPRFGKLQPEWLSEHWAQVVAGSAEDDGTPAAPAAAPAAAGASALAQYAVDLTAKARAGEIDPVSGRDAEIRQIVDILMRRRQNNPLLTGEAGVGKTAVVEGLALRIAQGDVPPPLRNVALWLLDLGLLQAGASMKGEFEARLRKVIDEVQASEQPVVLFIDELHTLVGAGGQAGTGDAANLLKPMLARGQLRTIGATTWSEYKQYIEKDPALTRRFQVVQVHEPDEATAVGMLRGLVERLQAHHQVWLLDEALVAAVHLSHRYLPARQLPDKAVALLDTACARVAVSQHATPGSVELAQRRIEALTLEAAQCEREVRVGAAEPEALAALQAALAEARAEREVHAARWAEERALVERITALRAVLLADAVGAPSVANANTATEADAPTAVATAAAANAGVVVDTAVAVEGPAAADLPTDPAACLAALREAEAALQDLQDEDALVHPTVDAQVIATVVADWTGIPVGRMVRDEAETVLALDEILGERVIGQSHGLAAIASTVQTSRARLDNPNKPVGVFLLCGPSGVGKTETALALAEALYGGEHNLITINMSEFQEPHTVSTLKGAPPGYVGYGQGGVLTEAVRRRPYSVVLLDEIEKAHADVHEIFFQVFDKGWMEDGEGRAIDFRNTLILLTSNVGSDLISQLAGAQPDIAPDQLTQVIREPLRRVFPAALLGRLNVVPYYPLSDEMLNAIIGMQLERIAARLLEHHGVTLICEPSAPALVAEQCTVAESGARNIDAILTQVLVPPISRAVLADAVGERRLRTVVVRAVDGVFRYVFSTQPAEVIEAQLAEQAAEAEAQAVAAAAVAEAEAETPAVTDTEASTAASATPTPVA